MSMRRLGELSDSASGSNKTTNLAQHAIGTADVGAGVIAASEDGPIRTRPTDGSPRSLHISIDNRQGSADAYLVRPEDIPGVAESVPVTALVAPAGEITDFAAFDYVTWPYVLRLLDGADVVVSCHYTGMGW